jgi:group I intron endonuclease
MIVYLITNRINQKIYIGKTKESLRRRWVVHISHAKTRAHTPLHNAVRKYGEHNFTLEIISNHNSIEEMDKAEIEAIKKFNSNDKSIGYNLTSGGDGAPIGNTFMKGHHHTKKSRKKMARAHKGLELGPQGTDHRDKISRALTGIVRGPMSEEMKREKSISIKKSWEERRKNMG